MRGAKKEMRKTVICLMLLFVLVGCTEGPLASPRPPLPGLTVGQQDVPVYQSNYCWKSGKKDSCVDFISPPSQVRTENPGIVPAQATMTIHFRKEPKSGTLQVNEWISTNKAKPVTVQDSSFVLPKSKGLHIYSFSAEWEEGTANYVCKVYIE
ncbi:hypothetical protein AM501_30150 [Aneurinibacillus migulanus]|uniref:Uncharacterized protein n=2 Tax=Aneurinibacillus migulanus TaxID=47500 RepID=A0A0M0H5X7_ANEMI|nr:hypothetical protein AF333_20380 [Aneurinibacillus migulanus]KPD04753.1 hypothetical protein AM501_30150 [Aneurinibacillus migulanus]CEH30785.1 Uncharacterized protein BN1090_A2_03243 [Aneurinibacillus migulanus]